MTLFNKFQIEAAQLRAGLLRESVAVLTHRGLLVGRKHFIS